MKSFIQRIYPETQAGGFERRDGTIQFYSRVNALIRPDDTVVDFGAGRGEPHIDDTVVYRRELRMLKGKAKEVIGVDVDDVVQSNPGIDRAIVLTDTQIPLPDVSVDMIVSDFTFEHLPDPKKTCVELDRILKPGGWLCARTPNRNGYIAIMNRLISDSLKDSVLRSAQPARKEEDVFPAHYRLNTFAALLDNFPGDRYHHCSYSWDAAPSYHFNRRFLFSSLNAVQSISPPALRTTLMIFIQKLSS